MSFFDRGVLRGSFAQAIRLAMKFHAARAELSGNLVRAVRRAVRCNDHFQKVAGIVERQRVLQLGREGTLFIKSSDDDAHLRPVLSTFDAARSQPTYRSNQHRVSGIRIEKRRDTQPEDYLACRFHVHAATACSELVTEAGSAFFFCRFSIVTILPVSDS